MSTRVVSLLVLLPACYGTAASPEAPAADAPDPSEPDARFVDPLPLVDGAIAGWIGENPAFEGVAATLEGWDFGETALVHVGAQGSGWASMIVLDVAGDLGGPEVTPGATLEFGRDGAGPSDLEVGAIGCYGETPGTWDVESRADRLTLEVSAPEAGGVRIGFAATFVEDDFAMGAVTEREIGTYTGFFRLAR